MLPLLALALAQPPADARALVEKAVAAAGGKDRLTLLKAGVWSTSGTVQGRPSRAEFRGQLPGQFRIDSVRPVDGKPTPFSRIVDGDRGWVVEGEAKREMRPEELASVRASFYHKQAAATLLPLLDPAVTLAPVPPLVLGGKPAPGVKASRPGLPPLLLHFDPATGLVAKSEMTEPQGTSKPGRKVELLYTDFKAFDGVKMAGRTKTFHDGKLFLEVELIDFKGSAGLPPVVFQP